MPRSCYIIYVNERVNMEVNILKIANNNTIIIINDKNMAILEIKCINDKLFVSEPQKLKYTENVKLIALKNES
jgi:hypothetical protein